MQFINEELKIISIVQKVNSNIIGIDLSLDYIKEVESKLTESQIKEFADDYNLSYDEAKRGLAEYIAYNLTISNS